jgi:hypothetical protein
MMFQLDRNVLSNKLHDKLSSTTPPSSPPFPLKRPLKIFPPVFHIKSHQHINNFIDKLMFSSKYHHFYCSGALLLIALFLIVSLLPILLAPKPNPKDHTTLRAYQKELGNLPSQSQLNESVGVEEERVVGLFEREYTDCKEGVGKLRETIKVYQEFYGKAISDLTGYLTPTRRT